MINLLTGHTACVCGVCCDARQNEQIGMQMLALQIGNQDPYAQQQWIYPASMNAQQYLSPDPPITPAKIWEEGWRESAAEWANLP